MFIGDMEMLDQRAVTKISICWVQLYVQLGDPGPWSFYDSPVRRNLIEYWIVCTNTCPGRKLGGGYYKTIAHCLE